MLPCLFTVGLTLRYLGIPIVVHLNVFDVFINVFIIHFYGYSFHDSWFLLVCFFYFVVISDGKNDRICFITSTVHPLPSILYCCVLLHFHLYHSGIVCNLAHSVGVSLRIRHASTLPSAIAYALPLVLAKCAGALYPTSYTLFPEYGCAPLLSLLGFNCLVCFISKLFSWNELDVTVGLLSSYTLPWLNPLALCSIRLSFATVVRQFVLPSTGHSSKDWKNCLPPPSLSASWCYNHY